MMFKKPLDGIKIVCFESRHAKTMGDLIRVQGGQALLAPSMKEVPLESNTQVFDFAERLFSGKIDSMIFLTGVGTKALVNVLETRYPKDKILSALRNITVIPRSPKPIRVLNELQIPYVVTVPEPNTWKELIQTIDANQNICPLAGKTVAVQEYGIVNKDLEKALINRGAKVLSVPVYAWALPDDLAALEMGILSLVSGQATVAMFTTAIQVSHVLQVAKRLDVESQLLEALRNCVVASVGPDCSEAIRSFGIQVDVEPESPKMGPLVVETALKAKDILLQKNNVPCAVEVRGSVLSFMSQLEKKSKNTLNESLFMRACRKQSVERAPIWLMRQAGRYMKDYRDIRDKHSFLEICKNKDLVTEITVTAQQKLDVDAAIIFADILLIVECFGLKLDYLKGDGPSIQKALENTTDVDALKSGDVTRELSYVYEAITQTRQTLRSNVPLLGFAGAPFTLASYMIEGGSSKDFSKTLRFMKEDIGRWNVLMDKLTEATIVYLKSQVAAGAQALQLFDSWVGKLDRDEYTRYVFPHTRKIFTSLSSVAPTIHYGARTGHLLDLIASSGCDVVSVDQNVAIDEAWKTIGFNKAIQGNLDPEILASSMPQTRDKVSEIFAKVNNLQGFIFNLGHGVLPHTPVENVIELVKLVKNQGVPGSEPGTFLKDVWIKRQQ